MKLAARFQRLTAEYAFRRLWIDSDSSSRFLVADEVGLGKTIVAREIVELTLDHLKNHTADVVYICASRPIATQNLDKLKGSRSSAPSFTTRLSLLATHPRPKSRIRFIALTPGTSFDIGRSTGWVVERALIWRLLSRILRPAGLEDVLRIVTVASWNRELDRLKHAHLDKEVVAEFRRLLRADMPLIANLRKIAADNEQGASGPEFRKFRNSLIGQLRTHLARAGVRMIARYGLIVLDEFQRFPDLLQGTNARDEITAELSTELFSQKHNHRRTLLLSATPYRMLGTRDAAGEKPHADLVALIRFLTDDSRRVDELDREISTYSRALQAGVSREKDIMTSRDRIQSILRRVMVRTERVGMTPQGDAMVQDEPIFLKVKAIDLKSGISARKIARQLRSYDTTEYWKSAPYMLDFMRDYDLKKKALAVRDQEKRAIERIATRDGLILNRRDIRSYSKIDIQNPRIRELIDRSLPPKSELLLWVPPSLPYTVPGRPFTVGRRDLKILAFSAWQVAPEAIAALLSYEIERRLVRHHTRWGKKAGKRKKTPLTFDTFSTQGDRLRFSTRSAESDQGGLGLSPFALLYPSLTLVRLVDPLVFSCTEGRPLPAIEALARATEILKRAIRSLPRTSTKGRPDERWYWAAPILLDGQNLVRQWLVSRDPFGFQAATGAEREKVKGDELRIREAIDGLLSGSMKLGRKPRDLPKILALMSLGSPGICAARALERTRLSANTDAPMHMRAAFKIARSFQSFFNQPESVLAVSASIQSKQPYWLQVIEYAIAGNLQALLDEQAHMEADGLSLLNVTSTERLDRASNNLSAPLRLRYAGIEVAGLERKRRARGSNEPKADVIRMRGRHAARFAEIKEDDGTVTRLDAIRAAFNSPFRPFILASTSLGQEGLDFHPWCHVVCHWNLPSGPVELEQREGRVNRYKGHAVRLNVARATGLQALAATSGNAARDPWARMFELAEQTAQHELAPFWVFDSVDDPIKVRRMVPMPALGRESDLWPILTRRLALYRLVLGQPRQEDLLSALERSEITTQQAQAWRIDLAPPLSAAHETRRNAQS